MTAFSRSASNLLHAASFLTTRIATTCRFGAFVRDCCEVGPGRRTWVDDMYDAWKRWCEDDGRNAVTTKQTFGRDLATAVPGVGCRRHRMQGRFYDGIALRAGGAP